MVLSVVVAEDNLLLREGVVELLRRSGLEVRAAVGQHDALLEAVRIHDPDVVVTDIRMPPNSTDEGVRAATALRAISPRCGVVVLSQHASARYAIALLDGGSEGRAYLLKDRISEPDQLSAAVRAVAEGRSVIDPKVVEEFVATRTGAIAGGGDAVGHVRQPATRPRCVGRVEAHAVVVDFEFDHRRRDAHPQADGSHRPGVLDDVLQRLDTAEVERSFDVAGRPAVDLHVDVDREPARTATPASASSSPPVCSSGG